MIFTQPTRFTGPLLRPWQVPDHLPKVGRSMLNTSCGLRVAGYELRGEQQTIRNPKSIFVFIHMDIALRKRDTDAFGIKLLFDLLGGVKIK